WSVTRYASPIHSTLAMTMRRRLRRMLRTRAIRADAVRWHRARLNPATPSSRCAPPGMAKSCAWVPTMRTIEIGRSATLVSTTLAPPGLARAVGAAAMLGVFLWGAFLAGEGRHQPGRVRVAGSLRALGAAAGSAGTRDAAGAGWAVAARSRIEAVARSRIEV